MIEEVNQPSFYYEYIIFAAITLVLLQILIWSFKRKDEYDYHDLDEEESLLIQDEEFIKKGRRLKFKYMCAYLLSKASMWAKAPYTYMLFSTYHKFTIGEIGILYLIDACVSLVSGPFLGVIADTFGRKFVARFYPITTVITISMRMTGNHPLAYMAQFMTGVSGGILATAFESWLNFEINELYGENKNYIQHFRKNMFSRIIFYDTILSLTVTITAAVIYVILHYLYYLSLFRIYLGFSGLCLFLFC
jgi:MFS family permease